MAKLRDRDLEEASSTRFLRPSPWHSDFHKNLSEILAELGAAGMRISSKRRREPFSQFSTTLVKLRQIRMAYGLMSPERMLDRTETLGHEAVHVRQDIRVVPYISWRYRVRNEVPAYRETLRIEIAHKTTRLSDIEGRVDSVLTNFLRSYLIPNGLHAPLRRILLCDWV